MKLRVVTFAEPLEARIAPATLVNPTMVTYTDVDGDLVTVKSSLGSFILNSPNGGATSSFTFTAADELGQQQLQLIDLHNGGFDGANLTISVAKKPGGDGLANVGHINSVGHALGKVTVPGDLGRLSVGQGTTALALDSLTVRSIGLYGTATQLPGGDLTSTFAGGVRSISVATDVKEGTIYVGSAGTLTALKIGGSLIGGEAFQSGIVASEGGYGSIKVGGNIIGGSGPLSGAIYTDSRPSEVNFGPVTIGGSIIAGPGDQSGNLTNLSGGIGAVKIGGNLVAGPRISSGVIFAQKDIASLSIGGSVRGGAGSHTQDFSGGQIYAGGKIGSVNVGHDVVGGGGDFSGRIFSSGTMGKVTIGGSIVGGSGKYSGSIESAGATLAVKIGHDIIGGSGNYSGNFSAGSTTGLTLGGSIIGGFAATSTHAGGLEIFGNTGVVTIGHDIIGGSAEFAGYFLGFGTVVSLKIGGSVIGGSANYAGRVEVGNLTTMTLGLDLQGGNLPSTATSNLIGSGSIFSYSKVGALTINGSVRAGIDQSGAFELIGSGSINGGRSIASLTVKGSIAGNTSGVDAARVTVLASAIDLSGAETNLAIGKISVGGRVEHTLILGGYYLGQEPLFAPIPGNADAQIGTVTVSGDWIASSLVAGAMNSGGILKFGDTNDAAISGPGTVPNSPDSVSKISSITVGGQIYGALTAGERFAFVAEQIGKFKVGGKTVATTAGSSNDFSYLGRALDMALHEVGSGTGLGLVTKNAELINPSTILFTDKDGDQVTVKLSKPLLTLANVDLVFKFDSGPFDDSSALNTLQVIDLTPLATSGIGITVTAVRQTTQSFWLSDGLADVGYIKATGFDVGAVSISGDLGAIDAGSGSATTPAVASLKVRTMGRYDLTTQPADSAGFVPGLRSELFGSLGSLTVTADMKGAIIETAGSNVIKGTIGAVNIGGSILQGGLAADDGIGAIKIRGDLAGGSAIGSGAIQTNGPIVSVTIGGSVLGGITAGTGSIQTNDVADGSIGTLKITGNLIGGFAGTDASIIAAKSLSTVSVGGSLIGASSASAQIQSLGTVGTVTVGHNLFGGQGGNSAYIGSSGAMGAVTVGGSLVGRAGNTSAAINSTGTLGAVKIGHNVLGGPGQDTGKIAADDYLKSVAVAGSLYGGALVRSGAIIGDGGLGSVTIGHDLVGGAGIRSGAILTTDVAGKAATSVKVGGSLFGGTGGNATAGSGEIRSLGSLGTITIGRDFLGGSITGTTGDLTNSGVIQATAGRIASLSIAGSIIAGSDTSTAGKLINNATIRANDDLGSLTVKGSIMGRESADGSNLVVITARTQKTPTATKNLTVGRITVGGSVSLTNVLAGFSVTLSADNGNAQVGAVKVTGNWLMSNLVAGVENYGANMAAGGGDDNLNFGDPNDRIINNGASSISKIASITIGGVVAGSSGAARYGFGAQTIGAFKFAGFSDLLRGTTRLGIIELSPATGDVTVRESAPGVTQ